MYNHAPKDYICPICVALSGKENDQTLIVQNDIFYNDGLITAFIGGRAWPNNPWGVVIVPNKHIENLYDISDKLVSKIHVFAKKVAIAVKELFPCDGTSVRQHNEPAGNQDAWHFHVHVMPRYINDKLYLLDDKRRWTSHQERKFPAEKLRKYFSK